MRADEHGNVSGVENPLDIVALIGAISAANFQNKVEAYISSKNKVNITKKCWYVWFSMQFNFFHRCGGAWIKLPMMLGLLPVQWFIKILMKIP